MGEDNRQMFGGNVLLFIGDKPIEIPPVTGADLHIEESESTFKPMNPDGTGSFEVSFTCSLKDDAPVLRMFEALKKESRDARKAMLWAVTHGHFAEIKAEVDGEEVWLGFGRPSQLRRLFHYYGSLLNFRITDRKGRYYKIKKGKIARYERSKD